MPEECLFCKIVEGDAPSAKVYENDEFIAFLDINPVNKGHTLLVPKRHVENLLDFPTELETDFLEAAKSVADAVIKATNAEGFNISMNNGKAAGQEIFHAHFHIIPRFHDDGHEHWDKTSYQEDEIEEYAEHISKYL